VDKGHRGHLSSYLGGLNGSTQRPLEVCLEEPQPLKSFADVESKKNATPYGF
jgi:hypothetical protein